MTTIIAEDSSPLAAKQGELSNRRERLIAAFTQAARQQKRRRCTRLCRELQLVNDMLALCGQLAESQQRQAGAKPRYTVSSLFLHECFKELTADEKEAFFFITGPEVAGSLVLNQRVTFSHERRTAAGVTGETRSTHRLLIMLERFRHRLLGHFHSHPGVGAEATRPSGIDEAFQRRLEAAGHVGVAAIFSRDGWVRFFRLDRAVDIDVFGQGVERHEASLFRLTNLDSPDRAGH